MVMVMDKKQFFNEMAATWDQKFYTPQLIQYLPELVSLFRLTPASKILDVGAGTGGIIPFLLQAIGEKGKIWAIDFAEEMIKVGKQKFQKEARVTFELAEVESLPYPQDFFDHIVCFGAFPHFADKLKALKEMVRVLKEKGTLVIAHALSSAELKERHQGCAPVSKDFLPEAAEMSMFFEHAGLRLTRLIDQPRCYLCEGVKKPFSSNSHVSGGEKI
jgi:ubiquinone/menaquinone biosynthesis C-methylase UbiE